MSKYNTSGQVPPQKQPNLEFQRKVVKVYDSSLMYSYNSVALQFKRTPQRIAQIHKAYPHDCPRLADKFRSNRSKATPVEMEVEGGK